MRCASWLVLLFVLAGAGGLGAQEPVAEAVFLAAVDAAHPAARALAAERGAAEAERLRASVLADPRLEATREAPDDLARETTWGVAWTPPIDGRRRLAIEAAEARVAAESHRLDGRLLELRSGVRAAYAAWADSHARASLLAEHGGRLETLARWMGERAAVGEVSRLAARRLEVAAAAARAASSQARAAEAGWRERAVTWLAGDRADLSAALPALPRLPETPGDLDAGTRPDVRAARSLAEEAAARERLSRRVLEAPELLLGWKEIEERATSFSGPVFALGWRLPVFDRRRADRVAAQSAVNAAAAGEDWTVHRARGELAAALGAYRELRGAALVAASDLADLDGMVRAATSSFELGESSVTDLLDTLAALLEARLARLDLHAAALDAHRQLELACGRALTTGETS